jgi:hypothetical protein
MGGRRTCRGPYSPLSRQPARWVSYSELTNYAGTKSSGLYFCTSWVGTCGLAQRNAAAPAFFPAPCCAALQASILIRSFSCFTSSQLPASHVELVLAQMTDGPGPPRSTSLPPLRPVDPSPSFDIVNICANLASISRDSLQSSHAEHPVSEYVVSCEKRFSVSSCVFRLF